MDETQMILALRALRELLDNVRVEQCRINGGYVRALGLTAPR